MNAADIEILLRERAEDVVRHLLPGVKVVRGEARCGDLAGGPGDSLKVCLTGWKLGSWSDFATGTEKGKRLIGLWHAVRGHTHFRDTMQEACGWLGVRNVTAEKPFLQIPKRPLPAVIAKGMAKLEAGGHVERYLIEKRGLTTATIAAYRVAQTGDGSAIFFPSMSADNSTLQMGKFLALARDGGKKKVWSIANSAKVLFGKHVAPVGGDLCITEGEIDAMTLFQLGYPAVSVPYGAKADAADGSNPNNEWIENDFDWLECFTNIYLCFDSDEPGQQAAASIARRLGVDRCHMVKMPDGCKDANEALLSGKAEDLKEAVVCATSIDPVELVNADAFREQVWKRFTQPDSATGLPFLLQAMPFRTRRGELTIWTGFSGSGKSEVLNHNTVYLGSRGERTCIASFEMPAPITLQHMTMQAAGLPSFRDASRDSFDATYDWLADRVWIVDRVGRFSWKLMLEIFKYARKRYGVTQFVVDSLLRCGIGEDDYDQQKAFVDALVLFAMENDCHVDLVAHSKKKDDESAAPGKMDVRGHGSITDLAHNLVSIFRNRKKETKIEELKASRQEVKADLLNAPDGYIQVLKQRETGEEPLGGFYFLKETRQFVERKTTTAPRYIPTEDMSS